MTHARSKSELHLRLRSAREAAGLTQAQVAKKLHLHRPTLSEIEAGRRRVTADELRAMAEVYGVSLEWLASGHSDGQADARILMAARQLGKLKPADLDRLIALLRTLRPAEADE